MGIKLIQTQVGMTLVVQNILMFILLIVNKKMMLAHKCNLACSEEEYKFANFNYTQNYPKQTQSSGGDIEPVNEYKMSGSVSHDIHTNVVVNEYGNKTCANRVLNKATRISTMN